MRRKGYSFVYIAAISLVSLATVCFAYVDDCDRQTTPTSMDQPAEELVPLAQAGLTEWEGIQACCGASLNPSKSYWYLLDFKWDKTEWVYREEDELPGKLYVSDSNGEPTALSRNEASQAKKSLGVYMAPAGNMDHQVEYLKEKASKFAKDVKSKGPTTRNDIWKAYTLTIRPTMYYCMPATTISEQDWDDIAWILRV